MARSSAIETLVGVLVVAIAIACIYFAYGATDRDLERGAMKIDAVFGRVDGVTVGSEVRIAGVRVGSVVESELDRRTYEARLQLAIAPGITLPDDTIAKIASDGVLGGAHVALEPGASEDFLGDGDRITITQGSVDLLGLAVQAFTSNAGKGGDAAEEALEGLDNE